jgi:hypothetical protein
MEFHPLHKCVVTLKMLGRDSIADDMDDTYAMRERTIFMCVKECSHCPSLTSMRVSIYGRRMKLGPIDSSRE